MFLMSIEILCGFMTYEASWQVLQADKPEVVELY